MPCRLNVERGEVNGGAAQRRKIVFGIIFGNMKSNTINLPQREEKSAQLIFRARDIIVIDLTMGLSCGHGLCLCVWTIFPIRLNSKFTFKLKLVLHQVRQWDVHILAQVKFTFTLLHRKFLYAHHTNHKNHELSFCLLMTITNCVYCSLSVWLEEKHTN